MEGISRGDIHCELLARGKASLEKEILKVREEKKSLLKIPLWLREDVILAKNYYGINKLGQIIMPQLDKKITIKYFSKTDKMVFEYPNPFSFWGNFYSVFSSSMNILRYITTVAQIWGRDGKVVNVPHIQERKTREELTWVCIGNGNVAQDEISSLIELQDFLEGVLESQEVFNIKSPLCSTKYISKNLMQKTYLLLKKIDSEEILPLEFF